MRAVSTVREGKGFRSAWDEMTILDMIIVYAGRGLGRDSDSFRHAIPTPEAAVSFDEEIDNKKSAPETATNRGSNSAKQSRSSIV
ncbi:unnamed protein product [Caenorhabditis auriculariae]|uniref:Uncharacterized protein n=1 Tax=Caenorhabditis auriculariae TaxID=2777116 RepID=A0A8S1HNP3_9PELO|nr:unnamed protein product [Caenorhabditis auriculariae]